MVHWQQPGLLAMPETDGHGDTCGPIVIADYLALFGHPLTTSTIDSMRASLISWGLMNQPNEVGMTLWQINQALLNHYSVTPVKFVDYNTGLDQTTFHQDIITAITNRQLVIYEARMALNLPDNQAGVYNHFVLLGGIDDVLGYWMCNGDTYTELRRMTPGDPVWVGIGDILASEPAGYIILPAVPAPPPPPPTGSGAMQIPTGWTDDGTTLRAGAPYNVFGITQGFRDRVLTWPGGWEPDNPPLGNALGANPVEQGNPALGAGTYQIFRMRILGWTPAMGVYVMWAGQELEAWEKEKEAAVAQVETLTAELQACKDAPPPPPPSPVTFDYTVAMQSLMTQMKALHDMMLSNHEVQS